MTLIPVGRSTARVHVRVSPTRRRSGHSPRHSHRPTAAPTLHGLGLGRSAWPRWECCQISISAGSSAGSKPVLFPADYGNDFPQPILDGHAVSDQSTAVCLGQRHSFARLAAQDLIFLMEEIVLPGQIVADYGISFCQVSLTQGQLRMRTGYLRRKRST